MINLLVLHTLVEFARVWYIFASSIAFAVAATHNYFLNKVLTFEDRKFEKSFVMKQWTKFFLVAIFSLGINLTTLWLLVEFLEFWYIFAQLIAIFSAFLTNFVGSKYWVFK
jgi:putative flippase GtrA